MDASRRPSKQELFVTLLSEGWVSLHIDARRPGVVVPTPFSSQPHLVLQYGRNMPIPIPDLEISGAGVSATLSFGRVPHRTYVPWSAVYIVACTSGAGVLYHEGVPREVSLVGLGHDLPREARATDGPRDDTCEIQADEPWLASVPSAEVADADGLVMRAPARRRRRPQLRLVK